MNHTKPCLCLSFFQCVQSETRLTSRLQTSWWLVEDSLAANVPLRWLTGLLGNRGGWPSKLHHAPAAHAHFHTTDTPNARRERAQTTLTEANLSGVDAGSVPVISAPNSHPMFYPSPTRSDKYLHKQLHSENVCFACMFFLSNAPQRCRPRQP